MARGSPLLMNTQAQRFEKHFIPEPNTGCWIWFGATMSNGYGRFDQLLAHRFAYVQFKGEIPENCEVDHRCYMRACVNPDHLQAISRVENIRRQRSWGKGLQHKTVCPQGHPYSGENLYLHPNGIQSCRTCRREADRRFKQRNRII